MNNKNARARLFRVGFKVQPKPLNHAYYEMQFGTLGLWLYSPGAGDAVSRARSIANLLHFDILADPQVMQVTGRNPNAVLQQHAEHAEESGFSMWLHWHPTGEAPMTVNEFAGTPWPQ
jgi:hypothetical protein